MLWVSQTGKNGYMKIIKNYDAKISICAGATVDFIAGNLKRAPKWMSNHGLEWLYRVT